MAIIQSSAIGIAQKSVGNITYRNVNGRVVVSQRITTNTSKTPKQLARRNCFGEAAKLGKSLKPIVDIGFDPVKNGSKSNNFTKCNTDLMNFINQNDVDNYLNLPIYMLYKVLTHEEFYGQVLAAKGNMNIRSEFFIDNENQINGLLSLSREFQAGDTLTIAVAVVKKDSHITSEHVELQSLSLGSADIKALDQPKQFVVNKETMPDLNLNTLFPWPGASESIILTAIVTNNTDRSTAVFNCI